MENINVKTGKISIKKKQIVIAVLLVVAIIYAFIPRSQGGGGVSLRYPDDYSDLTTEWTLTQDKCICTSEGFCKEPYQVGLDTSIDLEKGSVVIRLETAGGELLGSWTYSEAGSYHLKEKIATQVRDEEDAEYLKTLFYKKEYTQMIEYVETLKYKYDGEVEEVEKLNELQRYLNKRKDTMKRYKDYDGVKQKLKTYSKKTGLKYRNMGCQESNNYSKLTRRMKKKRMSWSKDGSENIAKVITFYASESCTDIIKDLNIQILPESYVEYAQKYIEEIENNIKELKKNKVKLKKEYTFKQGSLEGCPGLKKILENKPISELIYR